MKIAYVIFFLLGLVACTGAKTEEAPQTELLESASSKSTRLERTAIGAEKFVKNKKISRTTKGVVIGAVAGAGIGAAVSKNNRGKGALIGAGVGAVAGGLTGKAIDNKKKHGRVFKRKLFN